MSFQKALDAFALALAKRGTDMLDGKAKKDAKDDINLQEITDAFKALAGYRGILDKRKGKASDEDDAPGDGAFTFDNHGLAGNGGTKVRDRQ